MVSTPNRELWSPRSPKPLQPHHVKEFSLREFRALLRPFRGVEWFGQLLMGRGGAAAFEWKVLSKRVIRALLPLGRFRRASARPWSELPPDPAWEVKPLAKSTAAVFVALARR